MTFVKATSTAPIIQITWHQLLAPQWFSARL